MEEQTAQWPPALHIRDLIVAAGGKGSERILVPGLNLDVRDGETVVLAAPRAAASALLLVFRRRTRARYGWIAVRGRAVAGAPVRPGVPRGLAVCRPGGPCPAGARVRVLDGRGVSGGLGVGSLDVPRAVPALVIVNQEQTGDGWTAADRRVDITGEPLPGLAPAGVPAAPDPEGSDGL